MRAATLASRSAIRSISLVGFTTGTSTNGTLTLSQPTGVIAGDVGVVAYRASAAITTPPAGWTPVANVYYKVYAALEAGPVCVAVGAGNFAGMLTVFRGVSQTSPVDASATGSTAFSGTACTSASATAGNYDLILDAITTQVSSSAFVVTPSRGTKIAQVGSSTRGIAMGYVQRLRPGQTSSTTTWTASSATYSSAAAATILLRSG